MFFLVSYNFAILHLVVHPKLNQKYFSLCETQLFFNKHSFFLTALAACFDLL